MDMGSLLSYPQRIVGLVVIFLLVGQIMLFSATGIMGLQQHGSEFYYVLRQSLCAGLGLLIMFGLSRLRYQVWEKLAYPLMAIQLLLIMVTALTHFGHNAMGASRWIRLGPIQFQPSELAKITLTIYAAHLLASLDKLMLKPRLWAIHGGVILALLFFVFRAPDLGSTVLLCCILIGLGFIGGARPAYIMAVLGSGLGLTIFAMLHSEYRRRRVFAFFNPWADPQGSGFQTIQSFLSFYSGKVFGVGIGNGNSKLFFLPEVHTDFIFSLIGEELGFVGAVSLLLLFLYFGYLLFKSSFRAPDAFGRFLGFGLTLSLLLQIAVNLGGVTGLLPVKGLPLPFISWGRSALIVNLAMVGILLNIARQSGIIRQPIVSGGPL
jgi:cell division protein FtsW